MPGHEGIEQILTQEMETRGESFVPAPIAATRKNVVKLKKEETAAEDSKPKPAKLTTVQRIKLIEKVLDEIRPSLQRDKGDVELIDVDW